MAIPHPEPGLVLNYSYLWHGEYSAGLEEGRKDRPSVIVLSLRRERDNAIVVTVLPITHSAPADTKTAIEMPPRVKAHLGLDHARSWIVVSEGNEFVWPGFDLRKVPRSDDYAFGFLPPNLLKYVIRAFAAWLEGGNSKTTPRN